MPSPPSAGQPSKVADTIVVDTHAADNPATDASATNTLAPGMNTAMSNETRRYVLDAITDHKVDEMDPTRILMQCQWREGDPTWEDEEGLQVDVPRMWRAYISNRYHRSVLGKKKNLWHILDVQSHQVLADGSVGLAVRWVGSTEVTTVAESFVRAKRPLKLDEYWDALGGRQSALSDDASS